MPLAGGGRAGENGKCNCNYYTEWAGLVQGYTRLDYVNRFLTRDIGSMQSSHDPYFPFAYSFDMSATGRCFKKKT